MSERKSDEQCPAKEPADLVGASVGSDLHGIGGALVALVGVILLVAVVDEIGSRSESVA